MEPPNLKRDTALMTDIKCLAALILYYRDVIDNLTQPLNYTSHTFLLETFSEKDLVQMHANLTVVLQELGYEKNK